MHNRYFYNSLFNYIIYIHINPATVCDLPCLWHTYCIACFSLFLGSTIRRIAYEIGE